jgi:Domain of unknown function (DUF4252)
MRQITQALLVLSAMAGSAAAQLNVSGLDSLASKAKETVQITLDQSMLKMAGAFLSDNSKGKGIPKDLLDGLKAITVRSFEFDQPGQYRAEDLDAIRAQLRAPGWSRIINVQEKDESSEIYVRNDQGKVAGLAIVAAEPKELSVIYIDGAINLSDLGKLSGLGIPPIPGAAPSPKQTPDQSKKGKQ